ncbi:MAG: putative metal-binding motif-containing protein [Proteobacteria bacterium]|nr:putative metal-binding motif-containing protein [Pseudomonadota bacterium]
MRNISWKVCLGTLAVSGLVLLSTFNTLYAKDKEKPAKTVVKPNIQVVNPAVHKQLINHKAIKRQNRSVSTKKYQEILRNHKVRVNSIPANTTAKAVTTIKFQSQNNFKGEYDCDDRNRQVYPGAAEVCDGRDNDCDGDVDEEVSNKYFLDADGDSWGDAKYTILACDTPTGYSDRPNDCNDTNIAIFPGASDHLGNGIDENCNGKDG